MVTQVVNVRGLPQETAKSLRQAISCEGGMTTSDLDRIYAEKFERFSRPVPSHDCSEVSAASGAGSHSNGSAIALLFEFLL
jgi:hypothetical protein